MNANQVLAVVFDWAGSVVDYGSCAPAGVFIEVFRKHGIDITQAQAREPMGMNKRAHIKAICDKITARKFSEAEIDALYRDFIPMQMECIARYSELIPGTLETQAELKRRGIKIGTTTGYNSDMIAVVAEEARKQGFIPDAIVCASDVTLGRPSPWMALRAAEKLGVYPLTTIVKAGDTIADIEEGLNAGMWTIGLAKSGNELGLCEADMKALSPLELSRRLDVAYKRLREAGAHYVVDSVANVPTIIDEINYRLARGERP